MALSPKLCTSGKRRVRGRRGAGGRGSTWQQAEACLRVTNTGTVLRSGLSVQSTRKASCTLVAFFESFAKNRSLRSSRSLSRSACSYDTCVRLLTSATCSLIFARKSPARSLPKVRPEAYMPIRMLMAAGGAGGETARAPPTQRDDDVFRTKIEAREKRNNLSAGLKRS